ncbi:MAG: sigma-70 family RNA polymerase sigma factor [Planctomycetota bacterium]
MKLRAGTTRGSLLERLRKPDDGEAWQRFFELYAPLILSYALARGLTRADAEEVRDQTLELLCRKLRSFRYDRHRGRFKAWLHRIVRAKVIDLHRKRRHLPLHPEDGEKLACPTPTPEEAWESQWRAEHLRYALRRLRLRVSERDYDIFCRLLMGEETVEAICVHLEINANQVYKAKARVLKAVRVILDQEGLEE